MIIALLLAAADCASVPTQPAMQLCQKAAADRADAEMTATWRKAKALMDRTDRSGDTAPGDMSYAAALLQSQRAWLAFRDAECRIESFEWRGGSMQTFAENQCRTDVTRSRTKQLEAIIAWASS